ncbi:MAG: hypothetical protein JO189_26055 [Deltaproteobacteria bacterium]|nr:hypothetical protein [Deltaproteobacteria bacterium]
MRVEELVWHAEEAATLENLIFEDLGITVVGPLGEEHYVHIAALSNLNLIGATAELLSSADRQGPFMS